MSIEQEKFEVNLLGVLEAAKGILHLHLAEQEGLISGMPSHDEWVAGVDKLSDAISKVEGN